MRLPTPEPGDELAWVRQHLADLTVERDPDAITASPRFRGGQVAADAALAAFDVTGYAARRNEVMPVPRRGASALSPWIRHGLLPLPEVWAAVANGPSRDVAKFRDELLWQEYARHLYARVGTATRRPLRHRRLDAPGRTADPAGPGGPWDRTMACVAAPLAELERDGWMVNQTRMWMASQWAVRHAADWRAGEDHFFTHLLDGSRAANRLGWQWTIGAGTGRSYGFSRRQVERRAPELCRGCEHRHSCPVEQWPDDPSFVAVEEPPGLRRDPDPSATAGPAEVEREPGGAAPESVWLTAESLGERDPALATHPDVPVVFTFDDALLSDLRLSGTRLVFLAECLAGLAADGGFDVEVHRGDPTAVVTGRRTAVTFAPVPGFRRRVAAVSPAEVHPWPWLRRPSGRGSVASFSAWRGRDAPSPGSSGRRTRR